MEETTQRQEKIVLGKTSPTLSNVINNAKIGNTSKTKLDEFEIRYFNENSGILYVYILNDTILNENQLEYLNNLIEEKKKIINE